MKKLLVLCLLAVVLVVGCGKNTITSPAVPNHGMIVTEGQVLRDGQAVAKAEVMAIWSTDLDTVLVCDDRGRFTLTSQQAPTSVTAAVLGAWGTTSVTGSDQAIVIELQAVVQTQPTAQPQDTASEYWFGVYDTDSHGDVRFRYRYNFSRFYCSSWLPGWPYGDPNPNHWTSWNLSDFPYPWKGKKLLVPTRYQWWHQAAYGFSISSALFLISNG